MNIVSKCFLPLIIVSGLSFASDIYNESVYYRPYFSKLNKIELEVSEISRKTNILDNPFSVREFLTEERDSYNERKKLLDKADRLRSEYQEILMKNNLQYEHNMYSVAEKNELISIGFFAFGVVGFLFGIVRKNNRETLEK